VRHDCIPGYPIDRLIGKGGMAAVYLAIQESLDRPVALKILKDPDSPEFSERFVNEGRIIASLVHGNIVTVHDVGIAEGLHYISMEYVDGGDLRIRIADGQSPEAALDLAARMADCLGFAHRKGVIHRDLKPANILFRRDGTPLLTDFGIAKNQRLDSDLTATGKIVGTPRYMSPEQALGKPVDGRSDLYSLGVVLYEMLTGEPPYRGDSEVGTILKHLNDPVPALPAACRRYQPLLTRMLAKDPAARFADAGELLESLAALESDGRRVSPRPASSPRRPGPVSTPHASVEGSVAAPRSSRFIRGPWAGSRRRWCWTSVPCRIKGRRADRPSRLPPSRRMPCPPSRRTPGARRRRRRSSPIPIACFASVMPIVRVRASRSTIAKRWNCSRQPPSAGMQRPNIIWD
jgi:serine/threonine protein kinase